MKRCMLFLGWASCACWLVTAFAAAGAALAVPVRFQLDAEAMVTLNITRPDGWVVRELAVGQRLAAGEHTLTWDGRDNVGYLLPPGEYQSRLLTHQGITWQYVTTVGNSGTPPWPTPDRTGGWGGNHGQNTTVAVDETGAYLGWVSTEVPACIVKRTHDGAKGIWSMALGPFEGVTHLATDGRFLYGVNGRRLMVIDRDKGVQLATLDIPAGPAADVPTPIPPEFTQFSWSFATHQAPPKGDPLVWGLAAGNGRVYVSLPWRDTIAAYEVTAVGGKVELKPRPEENLAVPRPAGLALDGNGGLLAVAVAVKQVVRVDLKSKQSVPLVSGLTAPFALARRADGTLVITEMAPVHQVRVFAADGKPARDFGPTGGPRGDNAGMRAYVADAFWQPCAVAVNPDGSVWFVDDQFKRYGILSPDGRLVYAGFGAVNYAALCAVNPNDLNEVFTTMWCDVTFRIAYDGPGFVPGRRLDTRWGGESMGLGMGWGPQKLLTREGRTYMWTGSGLSIVEKDHLRPVMFFFPRIVEDGAVGELAKKRGVKPRGWNTDPTIWCDVNGDAAVQEDEIQFVPIPGAKHGPQYFGMGGLMDDFSLAAYGYVWKPSAWTAAGVPLFRPEGFQVSEKHNPMVAWGDEAAGAMRLTNGGFCGYVNGTTPGWPVGQGFWSGRSSAAGIIGYGADWAPLWRVGRKALRTARPGEIYFMFRSIGTLDDLAFFGDVEGCVHVVHQDGFYLQRILRDGWHTPAVGPDVINCENFSGSVFRHPQTGRRYLAISTAEATHLFELKGLETVRIAKPAPLLLRSPQPPAAAAPCVYRIRRVPEGAQPLPGHMGGLLPLGSLNWPLDIEPLLIWRAGVAVCEVRMLHDEKNLYLLAHSLIARSGGPGVVQPDGQAVKGNPLAAGETLVVLLRATGAGGDGKEAGAPVLEGKGTEATEPAPPPDCFRFVFGDVNTRGRCLVWQSGRATAPGQGGAAGAWQIGPEARLDGMPYRNGACYQMAIPLAQVLAGRDLQKPLTLRLDIGLVTPDAAGGKTDILYWCGRNAAMRDVENAEFHPESWGVATLDPEPAVPDVETTAVAPQGVSPRAWKVAKAYVLGGLPRTDAPARFQAAWDQTNLYVRVEVRDPTPLQNRAGVPELLFKGGDAVSLVFGKAGDEGAEQRVVFARVHDKPLAMLYRPRAAEKKPYAFTSPVSEITFDYVAPLPAGRCAFSGMAGGYVAEIAVPWKILGYMPAAGKAIPFDVQVIFSDGTGGANASCVWWRSAGAEAHANNDIPTEARLYPNEWGRLLLAPKAN